MQFNWSKESVQAVRSCWATPEGKAALTLIINELCNLNGMSFVPGDQSLTAFNEGRRSVGDALATALRAPIEQLIKEPDDRPARPLTATERANAAASGTAASPIAAARSRTRAN